MSGHISTNVTSPSFPAISQAASVPASPAPITTTFFNQLLLDVLNNHFARTVVSIPGIGGIAGVDPAARITLS